MEENGILGLIISLAIGIAIMAACGVTAFALFLVGYLVF